MKHLGVDIGATNIAVGLLDGNKNITFTQTSKTPTQKSGTEICNSIKNLINTLMSASSTNLDEIPYIGVGCPGIVNSKTGIVEFSSSLCLRDFNIGKTLNSMFGKKIIVENDANAAAIGEFINGTTQGTNSSIMMTIGTGIGTGIIINKKLYTGINYAGAECGHIVIKSNGRECSCLRKGCFEMYASATGLVITTQKYMRASSPKDTILWEITNNNTKNVSSKTAFNAAKMGDRVAKKIISDYIADLACGTINLINIFQPDVLCIGGGLSNAGDMLLLPLTNIIEKERYSRNSTKQTKLIIAKLGQYAGITGAAMLGYPLE